MNSKQPHDYNTTTNPVLKHMQSDIAAIKTAMGIKDISNRNTREKIETLRLHTEKEDEKLEKRLITIEHRLYYIIIGLLLIFISNLLKIA